MLIDTLQLTQLPQVKVSWDILVSTYVFFVVSSTGMCMITSVGHVFGVKRYEVIGRRGVFLAIVTLVSGWIAILIHLGRMERLPIYYILTANLSSAMWWMGFFYAFYFVFLIIELWFLSRLDIVRLAKTTSGLKVSFYRLLALGSTDESEASFKRDMRWVMIFGLAGVISAIAAHSTLGAVFGNVERALWYGAHMPLYFILTALISGSAWLILVTILTYAVSKREMSLELKNLMFELGKVFGFLIALGLLFTSWKVITAIINPSKFAQEYLLLTGPF
ncbi:MAG: polysulfide reductase NrfD, partial [Euryarchaeota archaeon]|nr:polysulfide reductase NrfD [Euryarchaeota archaeon]